ncbi:MAG: hypothetical protein CMH27_01990 [Micavibrio sp.]|nr:hypothetical protein [Micavibrio sp.]|tara:strand:- start:1504 stop:2019 length:516 start_codon:yes stop_codon:yes gene_type:complete
MNDIQFDYLDTVDNPLDRVEDVMNANNWIFSRVNDEELMVQITGKCCGYNLFFIWQEEMNALQFCAQYDFAINDGQISKAASVLMNINEKLWMGHFEIPSDTKIPAFRHTCLYRGMQRTSAADLEDLVEIALAQCEKHYAAFYILSHANDSARDINDNYLSLALMETIGES